LTSYIQEAIFRMDITISEHARKRMTERGVSEDEIRSAFNDGNWERFAISETDDFVALLDKTINGKTWRFVLNMETETLITCYPRR